MTENQNPHPEVHDGVDENAIAQYLLAEPGFFERHAELLTRVQLASPNGGRTISLQERQAEALREKIALLERREIGVHQWACLIALKVDPTWPAPTHYEICITGHRQRTVQHRGLGSIKNAPQADLASRIAGFT